MKPSPLRSPALGPQGHQVSTPVSSETSMNFPPPSPFQSALPKILFVEPCKYASVHSTLQNFSDLTFSLPGRGPPCTWICAVVMSECMSVMNRSIKPSLLKSKNFKPIEPQGVFGKYWSVLSMNLFPPSFR